MRRTFSWRSSTLQSHLLNTTVLSHLPSLPFPFVSRSLSQSPLNDEIFYDPPFSPAAIKKNKSKTSRKKNPRRKVAEKSSKSENNDNIPSKPDLPFDFMYSYSEVSPGVQPISFREPPRFSPFEPGRIDREWTGTCAPVKEKPDLEKLAEERERVLGEPLSEEEISELVERYRHSDCSRQINLVSQALTDHLNWQ